MKLIKDYVHFIYDLLENKNHFKIDWDFFDTIQNDKVKGITDHSAKIEEYFIFVSIKGYKIDSHELIGEMLKNHNNIYIFLDIVYWEKYIHTAKSKNILLIGVPNTRKILAHLSCLFYDFPSKKIKLIGVTGTNGKTSITYMLNQILVKAGYKTLLVGTYGIYKNLEYIETSLTTPDSLLLQKLFYHACQDKRDFVIMEVSSHAIYLDRVVGCHYDMIVFSSFSRDHLDFHLNLEDYFFTKMSILKILKQSEKKNKILIFNGDMQDYSKRILLEAKKEAFDFKIYSLDNQYLEETKIDYTLSEMFMDYNKARFSFYKSDSKEKREICFSLLGRYNISNALAVIIIIDYLNIPFEILNEVFLNIIIPGRYQIVPILDKKSYVIIDYAHTDDALRNILKSILKDIKPTRLITVFGCGGDRDSGKRSLMGKAVSEWSHFAIVTNDNPRNEDPEKIALEIIAGFPPNFNYLKILDRTLAIQFGMEMIRDNDVLLIAGKGSENEQIIKDTIIPFNDLDVVKNNLKKEK